MEELLVQEKKRKGKKPVKLRELPVSEKEEIYLECVKQEYIRLVVSLAKQIKRYLKGPPKIISLDTSSEEDGDSILTESLKDFKEASPAELAYRRILIEDLEKCLTAQQRWIIRKRFGIEDGVDHTLQEIADEVGICREGVRARIKKALARMRKYEERRAEKET